MPAELGVIPPGPVSRLGLALSDIKVAHSVFALPFAVLGAVFASPSARGEAGWDRLVGQAGLVVACMVFARTWAMLVNRIADWQFDRENPRTARRVIASGRLSEKHAVAIAFGFAGGFVACCSLFWLFFQNPWPLVLSVPVLVWIAFYSFTKRFTALCHVFLGGALAASPLAAAIAVDPGFLFSAAGQGLWMLAGMVVCWVAGFDIAYALQDLDFDRSRGLRSIPAALGVSGSLWVSRLLHVAALGLLVGFAFSDERLGALTRAAAGLVACLLVVEHVVLARRGIAGLPMAFFTLNGVISVTIGTLASVDLIAG